MAATRGAAAQSARDTAAQEGAGADTLEPVLVELWLGRLVSATVPAFRVGDDALVPVSQLLALAEIEGHLDADGRITARVYPGAIPIEINPDADSMRFGARHVPLVPTQVVVSGGELYVSATALGELFGTRMAVSWPDLAVTMIDPAELPVARRMQREQQRATLLSAPGVPPVVPDRAYPLSRQRVDGLVADYAISTASTNPFSEPTALLAIGTNVWGGSLEATYSSAKLLREGTSHLSASWLGVWPQGRVVRQLRVGDGGSTGPRLRTLQGVSITNAPYVRAPMFGMAVYPGDVGPGWEVEAYQQGRLVAFDSAAADGHFALSLPVQYGQNPVDVVAYGPHGEVLRFNRVFHVTDAFLPAHQMEYGLSAGKCATTTVCGSTANADVRYGITSRWTARAGADGYWRSASDSTSTLTHPYAELMGLLGGGVGVEVDEVVNASTRMALSYEPSLDARVQVDYTRFGARAAPVLAPSSWREEWTVSGGGRPFGGQSPYLLFDGQLVRTTDGDLAHARVSASLRRAGAQLLPYLAIDRLPVAGDEETTTVGGVDAFVIPRLEWATWMRPLWLRTTVESNVRGHLTALGLFVTRPVWRMLRVETGWSRGRDGRSVFSLAMATDLPRLRARSTLAVPSDGPATGVHTVQGSVLWNGSAHALTLDAGPALTRAGVTGRVFLDVDGDGRFGDGDEPLANVVVRVSTTSAVTDSTGAFQAWNLTPYLPVAVQVDSASLASPLWVPEYRLLTITPGANRFASLDLPIVPAAVVEGLVRDAATGQGVGGVPVILTAVSTGERRRTTTFSDGAFLLMGVRPGVYEATIDNAALSRLGAQAAPMRITVERTPDGAQISGVELVLRR